MEVTMLQDNAFPYLSNDPNDVQAILELQPKNNGERNIKTELIADIIGQTAAYLIEFLL